MIRRIATVLTTASVSLVVLAGTAQAKGSTWDVILTGKAWA